MSTNPQHSPSEDGATGLLGGPPDPDQLGLWPDAPAGASEMPRTSIDLGAAEAARGAAAKRGHWARRTLAAAAAVGLVTPLLPERAYAFFGIPGLPTVVIDPAAIAKLVSQLSTANAHVNAFVANTKRLTSPYAWRNPTSAVASVDALVRSGQAISYSTGGLAGQLATTFPGYSYNRATASAVNRTQRERTLSTAMQQLMAGQATGVQVSQSMARLQTMKSQLVGARTAQQVAELSTTIGVLQAEETTLLRQQLLAQQSAQAVMQADQVNRELQGAAAVQVLFVEPARGLSVAPPVRPQMNAAAYAF